MAKRTTHSIKSNASSVDTPIQKAPADPVAKIGGGFLHGGGPRGGGVGISMMRKML